MDAPTPPSMPAPGMAQQPPAPQPQGPMVPAQPGVPTPQYGAPHPAAPQQPYPPAMQQPGAQQPHPAHPYPQQPQAQPAGPMGCIRFTTQGGFMTASMVTPNVTFNGFPIAIANWGTTDIPVPAGPVDVTAHMVYIWGPYGRAGLRVNVQPGQTVPVFYAQPYTTFGSGRLGVEPQERAGKALYISIIAGACALPFAVLGLVLTLTAFA